MRLFKFQRYLYPNISVKTFLNIQLELFLLVYNVLFLEILILTDFNRVKGLNTEVKMYFLFDFHGIFIIF